jgi:hypothetical protein
MNGEEHPKRALLRAARARAIEWLTTAFTRDELGLEEFEDRLSRAYAAVDAPALTALVSDLSPESAAPQTDLVPLGTALASSVAEPASRAVAILGSVERRGPWNAARSPARSRSWAASSSTCGTWCYLLV